MTELLLLCRSNGEGPPFHSVLCPPVLVGFNFFDLGSCLGAVPAAFGSDRFCVLAKFSADGRDGSASSMWWQWNVHVGPDSTHGTTFVRLNWWLLFHLVVSEHDALDPRTRDEMCWTGSEGRRESFAWFGTGMNRNPIRMQHRVGPQSYLNRVAKN